MLDLADRLRERLEVSIYTIQRNRTPSLLQHFASFLTIALPIPKECRQLGFGDNHLEGAVSSHEAAIFEFFQTALILAFRSLPGKRLVLRDHEVLLRKLAIGKRLASGIDRLVIDVQLATCRIISRAVYEKVAAIVTLTEEDGQAISSQFPDLGERIRTVPVSFLPPHLPQSRCPLAYPIRDLVMVANFFHAPNRDALQWFLSECAPHLESGFTLHLCGLDDPLDDMDIHGADLRLIRHGFVESEDEIAALAPIAIAPVLSGSGIRMKNLLLGSMGKALVTTSLGNEGIEFVDGVHAVITDDPVQMAHRINSMSRDADLLIKMGREAAVYVRARFGTTKPEEELIAAVRGQDPTELAK